MVRRVDVDHLVVGAGAAGMAFVDALIDHADVRVAMVDRRDGVGGHWREAYPFVQLHQSSTWPLRNGVDPDAVCCVRPREPWMLDRANLQPEPVVYLGMVGRLMAAASTARSLPELFGDLEDAGIMLRVDRTVTPSMAKAPTLGRWELDLLRSVEHVVRLGHVRAARRGHLDLDEGTVTVADDALVVSCAADGLKQRPRVPVWQPDVITLQPVRAGFPCFGAALTGYIEATRDDGTEKNRLCPPSSFGNSLTDSVVPPGVARLEELSRESAA